MDYSCAKKKSTDYQEIPTFTWGDGTNSLKAYFARKRIHGYPLGLPLNQFSGNSEHLSWIFSFDGCDIGCRYHQWSRLNDEVLNKEAGIGQHPEGGNSWLWVPGPVIPWHTLFSCVLIEEVSLRPIIRPWTSHKWKGTIGIQWGLLEAGNLDDNGFLLNRYSSHWITTVFLVVRSSKILAMAPPVKLDVMECFGLFCRCTQNKMMDYYL